MSNIAAMDARRITMNAIMIALYIVLSFFAVDINLLKISFSAFPIILSAILFGPVDGILVGALGSFVEQMIKYGLGPTTLLWMIAPILRGAIVGIYASRRHYQLTTRQIGLIILISCLIITVVNTAVIYLDGIVWGYPVAYTALEILFRFISSIVMAAIFTAVLPKSIQILQKAIAH